MPSKQRFNPEHRQKFNPILSTIVQKEPWSKPYESYETDANLLRSSKTAAEIAVKAEVGSEKDRGAELTKILSQIVEANNDKGGVLVAWQNCYAMMYLNSTQTHFALALIKCHLEPAILTTKKGESVSHSSPKYRQESFSTSPDLLHSFLPRVGSLPDVSVSDVESKTNSKHGSFSRFVSASPFPFPDSKLMTSFGTVEAPLEVCGDRCYSQYAL